MRKISLQWRLTILDDSADHRIVWMSYISSCIRTESIILTRFRRRLPDQSGTPEEVYIDIPDNEWDDFAAQFATKVYNSKFDYRNRSLLITARCGVVWRSSDLFCQWPGIETTRRIFRDGRKSPGTGSDGLYD